MIFTIFLIAAQAINTQATGDLCSKNRFSSRYRASQGLKRPKMPLAVDQSFTVVAAKVEYTAYQNVVVASGDDLL
jgi:hypothetical protein